MKTELQNKLNGKSHFEIAQELESAGYVVELDTENNNRSIILDDYDGSTQIGEIVGDSEAEIRLQCECGQILGEACCGDPFPADQGVTIEYMPECLRSSHIAAGNSGCYPHNGADRLTVHPDCVEYLIDGEWAGVVD